MKIATFNINSVRIRLNDLITWMKKDNIDIIGLQETKAQDKDFPLETFTDAGYHAVYKGEKGKNGVALISKTKAENISFGLDDIGAEGEARLIKADYGDITVINTYVPQGREVDTDYFHYKLSWLRGMRGYLEKHCDAGKKVIWLGDLNVAIDDKDVYDPDRLRGRVCFHPDEQDALKYSMAWGFTDLFRKHIPDGGKYTFWDYRVADALKRGIGWRIDYVLATESLAEKSLDAYVVTDLREKERPSDHTPLVTVFKD